MPLFFKISFNILLIIRVVQGIGFAAITPLTIAVLSDFQEGNQEISAQGMRNFFLSAGGFLFPILGGALAAVSWNYPFACYALLIPYALMLYHFLPEPTKNNNKKVFNLIYFIKELTEISNPYINVSIYSSYKVFYYRWN